MISTNLTLDWLAVTKNKTGKSNVREFYNEDGFVDDNDFKEFQSLQNHCFEIIRDAINKIMYLNDRDSFIVERKSSSVSNCNVVRFISAKAKSEFTIVKNKAIQQRIENNSSFKFGTGKKAHPRRRHKRHLQSGKVVWVSACWVGPSEWKEGGYTYQVRLDV